MIKLCSSTDIEYTFRELGAICFVEPKLMATVLLMSKKKSFRSPTARIEPLTSKHKKQGQDHTTRGASSDKGAGT